MASSSTEFGLILFILGFFIIKFKEFVLNIDYVLLEFSQEYSTLEFKEKNLHYLYGEQPLSIRSMSKVKQYTLRTW